MRTFLPTADDAEKSYERKLWEAEQQRIRDAQAAQAPVAQAPVAQVPTDSDGDQDNSPAPPADAMQGVMAKLLASVKTERTPEQSAMDDRWRQAESQSLDQLTGANQTKENWAVGLGTAIPMLAGILADSLTKNAYGVRGTGLGQIAQAGVQNAQALMSQQDARRTAAQQLAEKAALIRGKNEDTGFDKLSTLAARMQEQARIRQANVQLGLRGTDSQLKTEAQNFRLDPSNPQAASTRELIYKYRPNLRGSLDQLGIEGLKPFVNDASTNENFATEYQQGLRKAGGEAAASTAARIQTESNMAPVSAATEAQVASARTGATVNAERSAQAAHRPAPANYEITDQAVFDNTNADAAARAKMAATAAAGHITSTAAKEIQALRKQYGTQVLPSSAQSQVEFQKNVLIGQLAALNNQGVVNPGERVNWDAIVPGLNGTMTDVLSTLRGHDLRLDQLDGLQKAVSSLVNSSASQYGIRYVGDAKKPAAVAPAAPRPKSSGSNDWSKFGL